MDAHYNQIFISLTFLTPLASSRKHHQFSVIFLPPFSLTFTQTLGAQTGDARHRCVGHGHSRHSRLHRPKGQQPHELGKSLQRLRQVLPAHRKCHCRLALCRGHPRLPHRSLRPLHPQEDPQVEGSFSCLSIANLDVFFVQCGRPSIGWCIGLVRVNLYVYALWVVLSGSR